MNTHNISGWGNYPKIESNLRAVDCLQTLKTSLEGLDCVIPRGLGRSYGDSALASNIISTMKLNRILEFDEESGNIKCEAGVSLEEIINLFLPKGFFLPVTPGTKFVTIGGAISADVHGKNHHKEGSFCNHVMDMEVMLANGEIISCSKEKNHEIFKAVSGGMGLAGVVLNATIKLKKVETPCIKQVTLRAKNIDEMMEYFGRYENTTYSVAWIDCLAKGENLGRSVLIMGEHAKKEEINYNSKSNKKKLNVPFYFPNFSLNNLTVKAFNFYCYHRYPGQIHTSFVDFDTFFYPLDGIYNWNRIYGTRGFTQYQFVLPKETGKEGMKKILAKIADKGYGSFLAILKLLGKGNENLISFPIAGYTLALDFPINPPLFDFLDELDRMVLDYGGRLNLSKDVRMSGEVFRKGYDRAEEFIEFKHKIDVENKFQSLQSRRLII